MDMAELKKIARNGESANIEFKKSTADLSGACESLCGMLNAGEYAQIFIGISGERIIGQEISDRTQQEIANVLKEFSPDPHIHLSLIPVEGTRKVIYFEAKSNPEHLPYFFQRKKISGHRWCGNPLRCMDF